MANHIDELRISHDSSAALLAEVSRLRSVLAHVHEIVWPVLPHADDVEHFVKDHADALPEYLRMFARVVREVGDVTMPPDLPDVSKES